MKDPIFNLFREETSDTGIVMVENRGRCLVLCADEWREIFAHGPTAVPMLAFEGAGQIWSGRRQSNPEASVEAANAGLARLLRHGIDLAYRGTLPSDVPGILFVRQPWTEVGVRTWGRFGAVILVAQL
jgi:hypothetical protein